MKTLKNHTLLFDAECPMCRAISRGLVKSELTSEDGTVSYQEFAETACPILDRQRAADEIALINEDTGEVSYGVESLFTLLAASYPFLRPLLTFRPFIWIMSKLYRLIASNRRVIVPPDRASPFSIQPTFRLGYRLAYMALCWLIAASILPAYSNLLAEISFPDSPYMVHLMLAGLLLVQGVVVFCVTARKAWDYLGNLMTITAGGSLLLLPALIIAPWIGQHPTFLQLWTIAVAFLALCEHNRRCKGLELGTVPSLTWILYFLLVFYIFA
jgi:predicted DCC family thiol-disulfide oxidoreductase YuxK